MCDSEKGNPLRAFVRIFISAFRVPVGNENIAFAVNTLSSSRVETLKVADLLAAR
jgi:hypothetical protein